MLNAFHNYDPSPILISFGPINIYWYGLFMVLGVLAAIAVIFKLSSYYAIKKEVVINLVFWLIIAGIIGARIYHVLVEWPYYFKNPLAIFKVWQGGLAIHGAIFAGLAVIWFYTKRNRINFWLISSLMVPGLALGQAIGRWGNYFNQELFGKPTSLAWGIWVDFINRPLEYAGSTYFHPVFLYESLGDILIFVILLVAHVWLIKNFADFKIKVISYKLLVISYLILYSVLRFMLEFIRIDSAIMILGLRFPQVISLLIIITSLVYAILNGFRQRDHYSNLIK